MQLLTKAGDKMSKFKDKTSEINKKIGAMYIAMKRSDTPLYAKLACAMCVWYALSPLDLVPDFIPVLGAVDDIVIMPFLIWLSIKLMPADIMAECEAEAEEIWTGDARRKKRYALPVLAIWCLLLLWMWHTVAKLFF